MTANKLSISLAYQENRLLVTSASVLSLDESLAGRSLTDFEREYLTTSILSMLQSPTGSDARFARRRAKGLQQRKTLRSIWRRQSISQMDIIVQPAYF